MSPKKGGLKKGRGLEALIGTGRKRPDNPENATEIKEEPVAEETKEPEKKKAEEKSAEKTVKKTAIKKAAEPQTAKKETETKITETKKSNTPGKSRGSAKKDADAGKAVEKTPAASKKAEINENAVIEARISMIIPNSEQPRREFDDASLEELAESIHIHGVLQPLLVQKKGKYYEIIAGERRWRAAKLAGLKKIPIIVRDYTPKQTLEISLIENIQRQDLNPIDEAVAYKRLLEEFSLTQADVAKRVSKSRAVITNALRLLKLDDRVQRMLIDNVITTGHARALLSIEEGDIQFEIANQIASEGLNVRDTEKLINKLKKNPSARKRTDTVQLNSVYAPIEEQIKQIFGTKVSLHPKRSGKGTIEIEYYSGEDLERILDLMERSREDQQ